MLLDFEDEEFVVCVASLEATRAPKKEAWRKRQRERERERERELGEEREWSIY